MYGLILSDPEGNAKLHQELYSLLQELDIPLSAFTEEPAPAFQCVTDDELIYDICDALLRPGTPIPAVQIRKLLENRNARNANTIRKYVNLQLSLLPLLRTGCTVTDIKGAHMLGQQLLVAHIDQNNCIDCSLPCGTWTELINLTTWEKHVKQMRSLSEPPVFVRENALLPIGVQDRSQQGDDADRVTLHWYQPGVEAACTLADGTTYLARNDERGISVVSNSEKPWHLIVHRNGSDEVLF